MEKYDSTNDALVRANQLQRTRRHSPGRCEQFKLTSSAYVPAWATSMIDADVQTAREEVGEADETDYGRSLTARSLPPLLLPDKIHMLDLGSFPSWPDVLLAVTVGLEGEGEGTETPVLDDSG